ncbi:MAG TPA: 16S rRNA (guanine(527)-N(7))-methyltransferase RsmG [Roseobacter sp.]|uniref:Ribosomal RNA small subunit methyltransferase G n=1 Tax=marine sediment metagenome TaxID=412755 RepID=A0A0F9VNS1_9ZZZZ|nr:16S rRNA (guanine(527)-N(7))-methyltransferase RsmG [Roseobacter sp.]
MTRIFDENVSRETSDKLTLFANIVEKWTPKINLISKASVPYIWQRHIEDSIQIYSLVPPVSSWVDLGSGGGFPAIVVALLAQQDGRSSKFTLVESDQRKCVFLRTAIRELGLKVEVLNDRIENIPPLEANVVSARALAELPLLIGLASRHMKSDGIAIFPKGKNWKVEDAKARKSWAYSNESIPSKTDPSAAILKIKEIKHV